MRIDTLISLFEDITSGHPADPRFFNGLAEDENQSGEDNYPVIQLFPPVLTDTIDQGSQNLGSWNLTLASYDNRPIDLTPEEKKEASNKMFNVLREIIMKFLSLGEEEKTITANNVTETLNYRLGSVGVNYQPVFDLEDQNLFGSAATFTILDNNAFDACQLDKITTTL